MLCQQGRRAAGAGRDSENIKHGPDAGWEDSLSPCEVTPGKSSLPEMPYQLLQPEPAGLARCRNLVYSAIPEV